MAKIKITADTKQAQKSIKELRGDLKKLQKAAKKPLKIKANTKEAKAQLEKFRKEANKPITVKLKGAGAVSKGAAAGSAIGNMVQYIPQLAGMAGAVIDGLIGKVSGFFGSEWSTNIQALGSILEKWMGVMEVARNPEKDALRRADDLDSWDDEKRGHNSKSIGDEVANAIAFKDAAGVNANPLLEKVQSFIDIATSGNVEEMEKAWKELSKFDLSWEEVRDGSTWDILAKMVKAYHNAGLDGSNELEGSMQAIVGQRQMGTVRKLGDYSSVEAKYIPIREAYRSRIEPYESQILNAADKSEDIRALAQIASMSILPEGIPNIEAGANKILEEEELKASMQNKDAVNAMWDNFWKDFASIWSKPSSLDEAASSEIVEPVTTAIEDGFNRVDPREQRPFYTPAKESGYEGLFHWNEKRLPNGNIQYTSFDPLGQTKRAWDNMFSTNTSTPEMNQSMKDVANELKRNTTATGQMTETIRQMGGSSAARFV